MNLRGVNVLEAMRRLIQIFAARSPDRSTLDELTQTVRDHDAWPGAHDLFQKIRGKTLQCERSGDTKLGSEYKFEEVCAKTLYNLSYEPAPFDADSPYWIIPNALIAARRLGIPEKEILTAILEL